MQLIKRFFWWIWAKKWRVLTILVVWGAGGYRAIKKFFPEKPIISYTSSDHVVGTWDVEKTLNLAGTTQFAHAQKLTFAAPKWRVTSVKVKIWEQVKKGQVLATITTDEIDKDVEDLKRKLKNAQQNLKKAIEKSNKDLDILKAQAEYDLLLVEKQNLPLTLQINAQKNESKVANAQAELKTLEADIKKKERDIVDKKKTLTDVQNDYQKLQSWANRSLLSTPAETRERNKKMLALIERFKTEARNLRKEVLNPYDKEVKLSSIYTPDDRNIYLWAKDQSKMNQSIQKYWDVLKYVEKLNKIYEEYSKIPFDKIEKQQILDSYRIFEELWNELKEWGKINIDAFAASIETEGLTKDKINGYVEAFGRGFIKNWDDYIKVFTIEAPKDISELKTAQSPIEELKEKLDDAKLEVEKAENELVNLHARLLEKNKNMQESLLENQLGNQKNALEVAKLEQKIKEAKETLDNAKSWETQRETLQQSRDAVDSAQLALTTKMKEYDDYKIIANFDGVVTKVNMQIWDSIGTARSNSDTDTKYIYVETPDLLEVKLEVDQIDIVKIGIGMNVEVYIDAFQGSVYTGVFSEIDTMPEGSSYKAKVVFKKASAEDKIFGGMSANVKVILESEKGKVVVPNPAIADNEQGEKIVSLKKGNKWIDQVVETGISDDMNTVILSGVKAWDTIKGFYMNETSAWNLWLNQKWGPSGEHDVTTAADGSMSYQYDG